MTTYPPRQPPRFVPTLTQVVADEEQGAAIPAAPVPPAAPQAAPMAAPPTPTGAVPVRTSLSATSTAAPAALDAQALQQLEERLMAQIQTVLEEKIAVMVQKHFPVLIGAMTREILRDIQPVVHEALHPTRKP